jgi:nucleoside-diphosphate-sugar epimerase
MARRILVTGASGFIGSCVVDRLLATGHEVSVLALAETVAQIRQQGRVLITPGDLGQLDVLSGALENIETVVHIAGLVPPSSAAELQRVNVGGTQNLVNACIGMRVPHLVYLSSTAVYKPMPSPAQWPIDETYPRGDHLHDGIAAYARSKCDGEDAVMRAGEQTPLSYTIVRPPVVYGPGAKLTKVLLHQVRRGDWRAGVGSRSKEMQWVYVGDLAMALALAAAQPTMHNSVVNVAGGELFSVFELHSTIGMLLDDPAATPPELAPWPSLRYDIRQAEQLFGYQPKLKLRDGVIELLKPIFDSITRVVEPRTEIVPSGGSWREGAGQ